MASVVTKRVGVNSGAAAQVMGSDSLTGAVAAYTFLNPEDSGHPVELVDSAGASWGSGFPLAPGASWSVDRIDPTVKIYVIAKDATPTIKVAVIGAVVA